MKKQFLAVLIFTTTTFTLTTVTEPVTERGKKLLSDIQAGRVDVNAPYEKGMTLLMAAARLGDLETVKILVECKANKFSKDAHGMQAIDHAQQGLNVYVEAIREVVSKIQENNTLSKKNEASLNDFFIKAEKKVLEYQAIIELLKKTGSKKTKKYVLAV